MPSNSPSDPPKRGSRPHPKYGERPEDGSGPGFAEDLGISNAHERGPRHGSAGWERNMSVAAELRNAGLGLAAEKQKQARLLTLFAFAAGIAGWPGTKRIEVTFDPHDRANPGSRVRDAASRILWALEPGASSAELSSVRFNAERWEEIRADLEAHADWAADLDDSRAAILVALGSISRKIGRF